MLSLDIAGLQKAYASGTLQPADVIRDIYRRIATCDDEAIWITLAPEQETLKRLESAPRGPLYGIPFAVKDNIDVAGMPTTCACPAYSYEPEHSAFVVSALCAAGAIPIGKTNLDQFATGLVGTRSPYGAPRSAFDQRYISGGSSSGSAVAVARGLVSFALGTDTAGSGRVPAAYNNVVGLKPSKGLISTRGVVPACRSQDTVSIFALTATDARTVAELTYQYDPEDAFARPLGQTRDMPLKPRVGIPRDGGTFFGNAGYAALYRDAIARLEDMGIETVAFDFAPFADAAKLLYGGPWVAERLAAIRSFFMTNEASMDPTVARIVRGALPISAVDAFEGVYELARLKRIADDTWQDVDVMMLPTAGTTYTVDAIQSDPIALNANLGTYTNFVNLMDLAAFAVPAGFTDDGLPFGVTFVGKTFSDAHLAALADRFHRLDRQAKLGATDTPLATTIPLTNPRADQDADAGKRVTLAVVGAHLKGQPLNTQLTERDAIFLETTTTTTGYSLFALGNTTPAKPGLIFDGTGQGQIEVELWSLDEAGFGSFVTAVPPPLAIGSVKLADGRTVKGFVCETHAVHGARDITSFGGWRAFLAVDAS